MAHSTSGLIGAQFTLTTAGTTTDGENAQFPLGTIVLATDGGEYMYVQAGEAIAQYAAVAINEDFQMVAIDNDTCDDAHFIGFAQVAFSDNDLGWVAISGTNINCDVITGTAADAALYADSRTSFAGQLSSLTSLGTLIIGVTNVAASNTSTSTTPQIIANRPKSSLGIVS